MQLLYWIEQVGVASTQEIACHLGIADGFLREWAEANNVRRIGCGFSWTPENVELLLEDLDLEEEDYRSNPVALPQSNPIGTAYTQHPDDDCDDCDDDDDDDDDYDDDYDD